VPNIDPAACTDVTGELWVNVETEGSYYLGARVDEYDFVPELIETNNAFAGPVMGLGLGPDLVVSVLTGPPSAMPGSGFSLDFEVCNQGTAPSPSSDVHFYVSQDTEIEGPAPGGFGADPDLGFAVAPGLAPGACHAANVPVWLASEVEGPHYLGAIVDEYDGIPELIESNNTRAGALMGIGTGPDLVVTSLAAPAAVPSGSPFDAQAQVCNVGVGAAPDNFVVFYLSRDDEITTVFDDPMSPDIPIGGAPVVALAPGACADVDAPLFAGVPLGGEGTWLLGAIVDEYDGILELIESNNVLVGDPLDVTPGGP
jgi:subtilase family serine protease